ncbi:MAG: prephenate dehydratase domain-containing protein [SAR324 cluster bacterium]|nr:prephenate dehydratase domain-containing protein [SAR324 cluster bacterium]
MASPLELFKLVFLKQIKNSDKCLVFGPHFLAVRNDPIIVSMPFSLDPFDKIFTLGPKGTFSNAAATLVGQEQIKEIVYCNTLPQITKSVVFDDQALGVIPIENSTSGTVTQAQDSLIEHDVEIIGEITVAVQYALVSHVELDQIERYYCHAVAFNQCMQFEADVIPNAEVIYANSNVRSAEKFLESAGQKVAAIVPLPFALLDERLSPLVKVEHIQDVDDNETRFLVLKKRSGHLPDFSKNKTSMYVQLHEDRHSLLFEVLKEFHGSNVNLCRLESRPAKGSKWQYGFFIDFYNNSQVSACLNALAVKDIEYKIIGSYSGFP